MHSADFPLTQVSEIRLTYRSKVRADDRPLCCNSEHAYRLLREWWDPDCIELFEEFNVMLIDRAKRCMGIYRASQGGTTGTIADAKLIFGAALKARADSIILAHNHPTGILFPSKADKAMTAKLVLAGKYLDLPVTDHLIIAPHGGYYSFTDNGLIGWD